MEGGKISAAALETAVDGEEVVEEYEKMKLVNHVLVGIVVG